MRVNQLAIHKPGGRRGPGRRAQWVGEHRLDLGHMKDVKNVHVAQQFETGGHRIDNGVYGKSTNKLG